MHAARLCCSRWPVPPMLEKFSPATMDSLGVGWVELSRVNPRVVYASGSGYGLNGPDRDNLLDCVSGGVFAFCTNGCRISTRHLQPQQRGVLLPAIHVTVVLGAGAFGAGKAHLDRQGGVVINDDDVGRVAVVEAGDRGTVDDFGVAGTAVGARIVKHDVDG